MYCIGIGPKMPVLFNCEKRVVPGTVVFCVKLWSMDDGRGVACVKKISPCKSCGPCEENNNMQALSTLEENGGNDTWSTM